MGNIRNKYFIEDDIALIQSIKRDLKTVRKTQVDLATHLGISNVLLNSFFVHRQRLPAVIYIKIVKYLRHVRETIRSENSKVS